MESILFPCSLSVASLRQLGTRMKNESHGGQILPVIRVSIPMTRTPNIISCWFVACEFLCRTKKNKHFSRINAFVLSDLIKVFRARARSQSSASWVDTFGIRLLLSNWIELGSMENVVSKRKTHCFRLVFCRPSIISWAENLYTYIYSRWQSNIHSS